MFLRELGTKKMMVDNPDAVEYTYDQVAEHKAEDDCWTVYEGRIYDVTEYAKVHPGRTENFPGSRQRLHRVIYEVPLMGQLSCFS